MKRLIGMALVPSLAVLAMACSDSAGVASMNETAPVNVTMQIDGAALASTSFDGAAFLLMGGISPSEVDSLFVGVTGLSFLSCDSDCASDPDPDPDPDPSSDPDSSDCCGYWTDLALDSLVWINLMALPTEDDSVFVIADGELPIGQYKRIRINVGAATVWFNTDQSKGQAEFLPDTEYGVTVPSGRLNTNVGLTVEDDGTGVAVPVSLVFDPTTTFQNVHTTGSGKVILTPQFRLR